MPVYGPRPFFVEANYPTLCWSYGELVRRNELALMVINETLSPHTHTHTHTHMLYFVCGLCCDEILNWVQCIAFLTLSYV